jgi:hypothetical protein
LSSRPGLASPDELAAEPAVSYRELRVVDLRQERPPGLVRGAGAGGHAGRVVRRLMGSVEPEPDLPAASERLI